MGREKTPDSKEDAVEEELLDSDDEMDEVVEEDEAEDAETTTFEAGAIPDGQLDATRLYLSEIGFSPLLSAEEEVHFARMAQRGEEAGRKRLSHLSRSKNSDAHDKISFRERIACRSNLCRPCRPQHGPEPYEFP